MGYPKEIYEAAQRELGERRRKAVAACETHKAELFSRCPQLRQIESEIASVSMNLARVILGAKDPEAAIREVRETNQQLQRIYREKLMELGYSPDYTDLQYTCVKCEDTGYVGTVQCECLRRLLQQKAYERLNAASQLKLCGFDNFLLDYYPAQPSEPGGVSPRAAVSEILARCRAFADQFSAQTRSLLFFGATGLGKTHLSLSIAKSVINQGYGVIYLSVLDALDRIEKEHFGRASAADNTMELICQCDLLILDDLGSEFQTQFTQSAIYNIINSRMNRSKLTIVNTNLSLSELQNAYSERVLSRIIGSYDVYKFIGRDIRQLKRAERTGSNTGAPR